jgi:two-component system chemotaxis response regulator CheB
MFRCFVGHAFSHQALLRGQSAEIERSLWTAVRALQSRASTWDSLARDARQRGHELSAVEYEQRAREEHEHAARARDFLLGLQHHHEP